MPFGPRQFGVGFIVLVAGATLAAGSGQVLVLSGVTVIDGHGGPPVPGMTLVVADGLVADMFPTGQKPLPYEAVLLDVEGQYVIPGLIDSHVHLTLTPDQVESRLAAALQGGVTAVRDMGGDTAWLADLRDATASPQAMAPRVSFAVALVGPVQLGSPRALPTVSATGLSSILPWLATFSDHTPVRRIVAYARHVGAAGIKLYSDVPADRVRELAVESRRQGLKVWSHARIFPGKPSDAVEAGVEVLSHASLLACEVSQTASSCDYRASVESEPLGRLFALMRDRRTILEPTLAMLRYAWTLGGGDPGRAKGSILDWGGEATRRARRFGVRITAGTDLLLEPGASVPAIHDEMELLVTLGGITPLEAITAATRTGAEILGVDRTSGTIESGKVADLVVLAADPTRDIRNTRRVTHVIKAGHVTVVNLTKSSPDAARATTGLP